MAFPEPTRDSAPEQKPAVAPEVPDAGHIPMTEELDRAKWTLPPVVPVLVALVAVAVIVGFFVAGTSHPKAAGKIVGVYAADVTGSNRTIVAVQLSFENHDKAPMWIKDVRAQLKPADQKAEDKPLEDTAASASDLNRYLQAFPDLAVHKSDPLPIDQRIQPGGSVQGMVLFAFPVAKDGFDKKQSFKVIVDPYDHLPVTIQQ